MENARPKDLLRTPQIAWPTVALALGVPLAWGLTVAATFAGALPLALGAALATILAYVTFTPMHDATHRSLARAAWVNPVLGRVAGIPLLAPFPAFRYMHLSHHKHTNEVSGDPDLWSGSGPGWLLPLRWATQDLHYYWRFVRESRRFSLREKLEVVATLCLIVGLGGLAAANGQGLLYLFLILIPSRLAMAALAFAFDYLPHRPHQITSRENRFLASHIVRGRWLTIPLMAQNYHLVHHLYPAVPFYRYGKVWEVQREALMARGAREVSLWGRVAPPATALAVAS
jgi:beta-carotene hydroxylase